MTSGKKSEIAILMVCLLALAAGAALMIGCGSSGDDSGNTFTVAKSGDRMEINLGTAGPGKFHFEARGFIDTFKSTDDGENEYIFFWIYSGGNFYYKGAGEGFLYIPYEYAYTDYWCNYGKVKGRSNAPGDWPIEECYMDQKWDSSKWYSFDVEWDGSNISISVDGARKHTGTYGSNSLNLIAGMGWPPADTGHPGIVGMEFRNWSFKKL